MLAALVSVAAYAQKDTLTRKSPALVDTSVVGYSILSTMPKGVKINQSSDIARALSRHIGMNHSRRISGYRVRIYFDNQQNSRATSEAIESKFAAMYPGIPTYRSYQAPFFKVTVGDFRSYSEAQSLVNAIKKTFPAAFIVKEKIHFPIIGSVESHAAKAPEDKR